MKKTLIILISIFIIIVSSLYLFYMDNINSLTSVEEFNNEYEDLLDKEIFGIDVTTLINKAIDNNEQYEIEKDEQGLYIEDNAYCLKIYFQFLDNENIYAMESIAKLSTSEFVSNFGDVNFTCEHIAYNSETNRVGQLVFKQSDNN